jgi:hypothetical protein
MAQHLPGDSESPQAAAGTGELNSKKCKIMSALLHILDLDNPQSSWLSGQPVQLIPIDTPTAYETHALLPESKMH